MLDLDDIAIAGAEPRGPSEGISSADASESEGLPVLTSLRDVRRLSPEEAKRGYPIRLQAVVTSPGGTASSNGFIQDGTAGIYMVQIGSPLVAGQRVNVTARTAAGDFARPTGLLEQSNDAAHAFHRGLAT